METQFELLSLQALARRLHLPAAWLRQEAEASRIPALRVGRHLRFSAKAVVAALLNRAAGCTGAERGGLGMTPILDIEDCRVQRIAGEERCR